MGLLFKFQFLFAKKTIVAGCKIGWYERMKYKWGICFRKNKGVFCRFYFFDLRMNCIQKMKIE